MSRLLQHPSIGEVWGKEKEGVVQFLGIPYATLKDRFSLPELREYNNEIITATSHGPTVVFPPESVEMEFSFIQQSIARPPMPPISDVEGLNLNITVPLESQPPSKLLPVLVYIHGGGFTFGSSSYPHYDQARIVKLANEAGNPIIAVNINYRLGVLGFLTSSELRKNGYVANNGLRDQRTALQWIQKYISGFGGNPEAVTVIGQSAGGASITFQLHSQEPLFQQCILLGGTFLMMRPTSLDIAESVYGEVIKELDLNELLPEQRMERLLNLSFNDFVYKVAPKMTLGPVVDGTLIPTKATFANFPDNTELPLPGRRWCSRVLSVDSQFDGSIMALVNLNSRIEGISEAFQYSVQSTFNSKASSKFLDFYNISPTTPDSSAVLSITDFITDIMFYAPAVTVALNMQRASLSHFNESNPWEGIYQGRANHMLDISYLWQNFNEKLDESQRAVARAFTLDVIAFTAGTDTLPTLISDSKVTVYGPSNKKCVKDSVSVNEKASGRREGYFKLADEMGGLDSLLDFAMRFLSGL